MFGGDLHAATIGRRVTHRIEGIVHEIDQHLLHLSGVTFDRGQIFGQGHFDFAGLCLGIEVDHVRDRFYHIVQVDRPADSAALLNRVPHIVYDVVSALSVRDHVGQDLLQLLRIEPAFLDILYRCAAVGHDGGKRLIQFVRERGRHFAEQTDTAEKIDLLPAMARFLFRSFACRDILHRYQNKSSLRGIDWIPLHLHGKFSPVFSPPE